MKITIRHFENTLLIVTPIVFVLALALSVIFGDRAVPASKPFFEILVGSASLYDHVVVLRSCRILYCTEVLSARILSLSPHNTEALGASAVSLCRRGLWKEAEPRFDQYFAEGGSAPDVQKWYQKLLSQQASVDAKR